MSGLTRLGRGLIGKGFGTTRKFTDKFGGGSPNLPSIGGASADTYINNLRLLRSSIRASASGMISPVLSSSISDILGKHGMATDELGKALAGGALTIPSFEADAAAGAISTELSDFQTAIAQVQAGARATQGQSGTATIAEGTVSGFATGGPIGAIAGFIGGGLRATQNRRAKDLAKAVVRDAQRLASPENFAANLSKVSETSREETFVSGQQAQLAEEAAVSQSGLRGTGIGTQASIAASVAPQVAALRKSIGSASAITGNEVSARLGTPVRPPKTTLMDALGAVAGAAGAYFTPEEQARRRFAKKPITEGRSYTDVIGSNIAQPTFGEV